jgi:hypothetical protein
VSAARIIDVARERAAPMSVPSARARDRAPEEQAVTTPGPPEEDLVLASNAREKSELGPSM